jgi:hypothetical protein
MLAKIKEFVMKEVKKQLAKMKNKGDKDEETNQPTKTTSSSSLGTKYEVATPTAGATHRALLIGINYPGTSAALKGCINDVKNVQQYLAKTHPDFNQVLVLTDDKTSDAKLMPTHANIISAMKWLVAGAKPGDSFFLHYVFHYFLTSVWTRRISQGYIWR